MPILGHIVSSTSTSTVGGVDAMLCTALDLSRTTETAQDRRAAQRKYQEDGCTAKCCDMKFVN